MSATPDGATVDEATLARCLELAVGLAEAAGEHLLEASVRRVALRAGASAKSSRTDLATDADRASEQLIRAALASARPDDAILGEEAGASTGTSGLTWVVDPLDGTINFVYGFPAWSVSIALVGADGKALVGAVRDAERRETFSAVRAGGAFLDGAPIAVNEPSALGEMLVGTGFSYLPERRAAQGELLGELLPAVRDIRRAGSAALDLCWVAAGRLDAFYEAALKPWDSAAGLLVAEEAGAASRSVAGLVPDSSTLVVAHPDALDELVELLERRRRVTR